MRHLTALDAMFLQLETPDTPMHVGSVMVLEKASYKGIRDHVARRLHVAPLFSRKLAFMPMDLANPVWIDAAVDLDYHVARKRLRAPGSAAQLEAAVAALHEGALDRDRPLWRFTVIEGLAGGEVAIYAKIHHAALDGEGGIAVARALLDVRRKPRIVAGPGGAQPRLAPTTARMVGAALRNTVAQYGRIAMAIPGMVKAAGRTGVVAIGAALRKGAFTPGPRTSMNAAIGPRRQFATVRIPLAEAKAIARRFDAKLNDVVLATCAGALRRQFAGDRAALSRAMIGAVPASLRAPGDTTRSNDVTMMLVGLATDEPDPLKRLEAIKASSTRAKALAGSLQGAGVPDLPTLGIPWLMAAIMPLYRGVASSKRVPVIANLIVSNVPGPQVPLYMAGARVRAYFPVSAVSHGLGLNITILSYDGSLDYGLLAAKGALPGLRLFARRLQAAHAELRTLAGVE
jgi:diacylglycerol O-acyltransferase